MTALDSLRYFCPLLAVSPSPRQPDAVAYRYDILFARLGPPVPGETDLRPRRAGTSPSTASEADAGVPSALLMHPLLHGSRLAARKGLGTGSRTRRPILHSECVVSQKETGCDHRVAIQLTGVFSDACPANDAHTPF
jgi:hypothetical protein